MTSNGTGVNIGYTNYFPFGATQQTSSVGGYANPYSYLGSEKDAETGLQYLQARYYNSVRGVFLSQDPVFLALGSSSNQKYEMSLLMDPQLWNSYSYARSSPYTQSDSTGTFLDVFVDVVFVVYDIGDIAVNVAQRDWKGAAVGGAALAADGVATFVPFATGAGVAVRVGAHADNIADAARAVDRSLPQRIGSGHAFDKHVVSRNEFPGITTREEFGSHIEDVMNNPTEVRDLDYGRTGYWSEDTGTVVIHDPGSADGGTAFTSSYDYFKNKLE